MLTGRLYILRIIPTFYADVVPWLILYASIIAMWILHGTKYAVCRWVTAYIKMLQMMCSSKDQPVKPSLKLAIFMRFRTDIRQSASIGKIHDFLFGTIHNCQLSTVCCWRGCKRQCLLFIHDKCWYPVGQMLKLLSSTIRSWDVLNLDLEGCNVKVL